MKGILRISILVIVCLLLRIPGTFWGFMDRENYTVFEPDEYQHFEIAVNQIMAMDKDLYPDRKKSQDLWNVRGFGTQLGVLAYIGEKLDFVYLKVNKIILVGRFLSVFYSLFLILLVFQLGKRLFSDPNIGFMAALLVSVFDLNCTYSHYALPASSYIFWVHMAVFSIILFLTKILKCKPESNSGIRWDHLGYVFLIGFTSAMSLAVKLDFIPLLVFFPALVILAGRKKLSLFQAISYGFLIIPILIFSYFLAHGFNFSLAELDYSFDMLRGLNENIIPKANHWLYNPVLYFMAVLAGTSLPVFFFAQYWYLKLSFRGRDLPFQTDYTRIALIVFTLFLLLEFFVRWRMDTPFVRRANIFLPFVALMASYGLYRFYMVSSIFTKKIRLMLVSLVFVYTASITVVFQSNFWFENRYRAKEFVEKELKEGQSIQYSTFAKVKGVPKNIKGVIGEGDILVIHETQYGRYWKYFTTPFKIPHCCDEVYHCASGEECDFYQRLFSGRTDYNLIAEFPTLEVFPERLLFKRLFGTYETFLGDVKVYSK